MQATQLGRRALRFLGSFHPLGFCLGLIESFLWGAYAGLVFVPTYSLLSRRWGVPTAALGRRGTSKWKGAVVV
jgi:hypothetical protein